MAGPLLVVAARQTGITPDGLVDSKLLTRMQREAMYDRLAPNYEFGEGWVSATEIDRRGLTSAMKLGVKRALRSLRADHQEEVIMDGPINYLPKSFKKVQCLIDADMTVSLVSAASIYAKVTRDRYMVELARRHPRYGFESHVGYGTPDHLSALDKFGSLKKVHRQFFEPIYQLSHQTKSLL